MTSYVLNSSKNEETVMSLRPCCNGDLPLWGKKIVPKVSWEFPVLYAVPDDSHAFSVHLWEELFCIFALPSHEADKDSSKVPLNLLFLTLPWKSLQIIKKYKFKGFNILCFEQEGIKFSGFYAQPQRLLFFSVWTFCCLYWAVVLWFSLISRIWSCK